MAIDWQSMFLTGLSTFVGAAAAFLLERQYSEKRERDGRVSAAKQAQYVLWSMYNLSMNIKKQLLDPNRDLENRHLLIAPHTIFVKIPPIDSVSLSFMLEGDGANLLTKIMLAEQHFRTMVGALEERNTRHVALQKTAARYKDMIIDESTWHSLLDLTNIIYEQNELAAESIKNVFGMLKKYIEKRYPSAKALTLEDKAEKIAL